MDLVGGQLSYHFHNTVALTALVAAFVLWRYRAAVLGGMRRAGEDALAVRSSAPVRATQARDLAAWERQARPSLAASWFLGVAACSLALGVVYAHFSDWTMGPTFLLMLTLVFATVSVPIIAVALAWPFWLGAVALLLYLLMSVLLVLVAGSIERAIAGRPVTWQQLQLGLLYLQFAANTLWLPALLLLATGATRLRGVVPITLASLLVFGLAPFLGARLTALIAEMESGSRLALWLGSNGVFLLVALPIGWLAWKRLHAVARAYEAKRFSDLQLLAGTWWLLLVATVALELFSTRAHPWLSLAACTAAYLVFTPITRFALGRSGLNRGRPPPRTLLLLRVFGYRARTERLFDRIGARWRLLGPVSMIAGPDVAARIIGPGDFLRYLTGRIHERFVTSRTRLDELLASRDQVPDPDGRYRINPFYCRSDTWQATVVELMQEADAVLMDLRGFDATHGGCEFELRELGARLPADRVVFLVDSKTDQQWVRQCLADPTTQQRDLIESQHGSDDRRVFRALMQAAGDQPG